MKVCREKELNLCCFFLWRVKRVPVFMAGALLIFRSLLENGMGTFSIPKRIEKQRNRICIAIHSLIARLMQGCGKVNARLA